MFAESLDKKQFEVTDIDPRYTDDLIGGHFEITFGVETPVKYRLEFGSFISYMFERDVKLKEYMAKLGDVANAKGELVTFSDVIHEMYSLELPVMDWASDYIYHVKSKLGGSAFDNMISLFKMLKEFGQEPRNEENDDE